MIRMFILLIFNLITVNAICQDSVKAKIDIGFKFNNYRVCDLSDNFKIYFFFIDKNNNFKLIESNTIGKSISFDLDFENMGLIEVVFQYKKYTLCFNRLSYFRDSLRHDNDLNFKIVKRNGGKKYIRKSYSRQYKDGKKKLGDWDFDISCCGKSYPDGTYAVTIFEGWYRRNRAKNFKNAEQRNYYTYNNSKVNGIIEASYSYGCCFVKCSSYGYKRHKKFFTQNELYFKILQSLDGVSAEKTVLQNLEKSRKKIQYEKLE